MNAEPSCYDLDPSDTRFSLVRDLTCFVSSDPVPSPVCDTFSSSPLCPDDDPDDDVPLAFLRARLLPEITTPIRSYSSSDEQPTKKISTNPSNSLQTFSSILSQSPSRSSAHEAFKNLRAALPPVPVPYTPTQLAALWTSEQYAQNPLIEPLIPGDPAPASAFVYKKVANKTRPVATTLPENFRIIRKEHPNPLDGMLPMPVHPPEFTPVGRFTKERRDQMTFGRDLLLPEEVRLAEWIIGANQTAFAWTDEERGTFSPEFFAPIEIPHIEHIPWVLRQGPIPRGILSAVTKIIEEKWKSGVYEPSSSSYNSRWFCVFKKDGKSLRLVHSLEPLNAITVKNAAMPPYTDVVAEDFAQRSIYSTLDLYVSFDQRQLHANSRDLTTFNTPLGAFRLTVLPMGWTNSPAVLQGDITHVLQPEIPHWTQPFADDVPVKGPKTRYERPDGTFETIPGNPGIRRFVWEHFEALHRIIHRVKSYGATFSGKKAFIGMAQADILGHLCTYEGRIVDPLRAEVIQKWPIPRNVSDVRAFLGTCGVHRIFIKDYTIIARPLITLTRKGEPFEIGPDQLEAMDLLKEAIVTSPALRPLDYESEHPVILAVDSCANGVGYILSQRGGTDNRRYPSRFGSITFNDRESRYSQAKLELYGLFRSLKQTQLYTIGAKKLTVEMDAKFIKGMINSPTLHPNDAVNRWIAAILLFDFELIHVPAYRHTGADGLSRRPRAPEDPPFEDPDELEDWIDTNAGFFLELNTPHSKFDPSPPLYMALYLSSQPPRPFVNAPAVLLAADRPRSSSVSSTSSHSSASSRSSVPSEQEIQTSSQEIPRSNKAARREEKLSVIRDFLHTLKRPPDFDDETYRHLIRQAMGYYTLDGKLFRKTKDGAAQLVPDVSKRLSIIQYAHDHLGHKGVYATSRNILVRFWWPLLNDDVRWYIRTCHECQVRQTKYFHIPPSVPFVPSLFRKAHMDTFLMPAVGSYRYVLHARCATISYPEARATTAETGRVTGDFIFHEILCRWGALEEIVTDNGAPWIAGVEDVGTRYGIHHIRVSGYNSQANGIVESKHFDVREAIMKTCKGDERKWRQVLPQVLWAERVTIRKSTGYSPYYLAHGVHPLLPFDILEATYLAPTQDFGITTEDLIALRAQQLAKRPEDVENIQRIVTKSRQQNLLQFERRHASQIIDFDFSPGALVLVRNTRVEESLNRKTKPRYLGPMVVVRKTIGTSYIVAELDGTQSMLRVAGFRLIPYFPRTHTDIPIISNLPDDDDATEDDPADDLFLESLDESLREYHSNAPPRFTSHSS